MIIMENNNNIKFKFCASPLIRIILILFFEIFFEKFCF
jgi:hypothetical protein